MLGFAEGFYPGETLESSQGCKSGMLLEPGKSQAGQAKEPGVFVLPWAVTTAPGPGESPGWGLCSEDHSQAAVSSPWADPAPWILFWSIFGPGQPEAEGKPGCGEGCVPSDLLQSSGLPHSSV